LTALSATLGNWEDTESKARDAFNAEIISIFYEIMVAELKEDY